MSSLLWRNQTGEFVLTTFGLQQFIFGQLAPSELGGADLLFPLALEFVCTG